MWQIFTTRRRRRFRDWYQVYQPIEMDWSVHPTFHLNDGRRPEAEQLTEQHIEDRNLRARGVTRAVFVSTFHSTDGGESKHITVRCYKADGEFETTQHVQSNRTAEEIRVSIVQNKERKRDYWRRRLCLR